MKPLRHLFQSAAAIKAVDCRYDRIPLCLCAGPADGFPENALWNINGRFHGHIIGDSGIRSTPFWNLEPVLCRCCKLARVNTRDKLSPVKVLFIGDIVGEPGRHALRQLLPGLRQSLQVDVVVANGENAAGGAGITVNTAGEILQAGVDVITTGDHLWDQKEVSILLQTEPRFLRPLNYPAGVPGQGSTVWRSGSLPPLGVLNLQGRTFLQPLENPFLCAQTEVARLREMTRLILVDMHAEATSEKIAMGRMLDGQVSAVVGTHTHVQTADEQIFPGGTAYLTDAGFTGPHESVLGREIEPIIERFRNNTPQKFGVAKGRILLQGALIEIDNANGRALSIGRISEPLPTP